MYTLLTEIRAGRETFVWRGLHESGTRVSIKEPAATVSPADRPRVVSQLEREYRFLNQLGSERIVRPLQWEEGGRLLFEDTQGNLGRLLDRETKLPVDLVALVLVDCLTGLAHLHERKLAHGTLCTSSVLVSPEGNAKLGDFVGFRVDQGVAPPAPEFLLKYRAPEMLTGTAGTDPADVRAARLDLYSLGFLACELLAGRDNFDRIFWPSGVPRESDANWLWWHGDPTKEFPALETVLPDVPRAMVTIIKSLIAKNPAERPRSAREVAAKLTDTDLLSDRTLPLLDSGKPDAGRRRDADDPYQEELPAGRLVTVVRKTTLELWPDGAEIHSVRFSPKHHALIGAGEGSRFRLPYSGVSEKHAMVLCQDTGHWWVYDLRSRTGFEVNGVKTVAAELDDGDTFRIPIEGLPAFRVRLVEAENLVPNIEKFEIGKRIHHSPDKGDLYLARWQGRNRLAAVRVFPPGFAADVEGLRRFIERIPEAGKLRHPNLVALYRGGFVTRDEQREWFLATEYLAGGSLRDRLFKSARPLPVIDALRTGVHIAAALSEVAARRFVHRNVNPSCILYAADGTAKLGDFFLLRDEVVQTLHQITQAATPQGECVYQAPEVLAGTKRLTPACDLYSLAACLYEALTRRPPFDPEQGMVALYDSIQEKAVEHPRRLNSAVPDKLGDLILKGLAKDPDRRPASPEEFGRELQALLDAATTGPV